MKKITTTIRGVEESTWKAFRKKCVDCGLSANKKLIELIEDFVKKKG